MMSTANEKANLKGTFTAYIIGVVLIFACSTIASSVANVVSSTGNNTASGVIDTAMGIVDAISGEIVEKEEEKENEGSENNNNHSNIFNEYGVRTDENGVMWVRTSDDYEKNTVTYKAGMLHIYKPIKCSYKETKTDKGYTIEVSDMCGEKNFSHFEVVMFGDGSINGRDNKPMQGQLSKILVKNENPLEIPDEYGVYYIAYAIYEGMEDEAWTHIDKLELYEYEK